MVYVLTLRIEKLLENKIKINTIYNSLKNIKYVLKPEIHCIMHQMSLFLHASKMDQQILAVKKPNLPYISILKSIPNENM